MGNELTNVDYWIKAQGRLDIHLDEDNPINKWLKPRMIDSEIKSIFEVGCYPGKFLTILGSDKIEVNGLDFIPNVVMLNDAFSAGGYKVGEFFQADFLSFKPMATYDCVMSFGFIEHFEEWETVFTKHFELINEKGYLVIEVPNFRGYFQRLPRRLFDNENYKRHNIESMNLIKWKKILEMNGFEILHEDYLGGYLLWFENSSKSRIKALTRSILVRILKVVKSILYSKKENHKNFSAAIGIIARKKHSPIIKKY